MTKRLKHETLSEVDVEAWKVCCIPDMGVLSVLTADTARNIGMRQGVALSAGALDALREGMEAAYDHGIEMTLEMERDLERPP